MREHRRLVAGRFRLESELARGGMGVVYAALDESAGQRVALKRLIGATSAHHAALFEREFHVLSSLRHPRIIEAYEYGVDEEGPYYTMELLEGSDLRAAAPVDVPTACRYLRDVASSLSLLHARRLVHRDVSPSNVRITPDGRCKLIDFGALASVGAADDIAGTPPAIPPEALFGQSLDQRADLFSLGALAYWILTGRHAYPARRVAELGEAWVSPPPLPSLLSPGVPPELDQLVLSLLCLDVLGRPSSASEVIERLEVIGNLAPDEDARAAQAFLVSTPLVERGPELDRASRRIRQTRKGTGASLFVESAPGVGRSRYLREVTLSAQLSGLTVISVDAGRNRRRSSLTRALVSQLFRVAPDLALAALGEDGNLITAALGDSVPPPPDGGRSQPPPGGADPSEALPAALSRVLSDIARKKPLLVAVDDVDQADPASAALLLRLVHATLDAPLFTVLTVSASGEDLPPAVRAMRDASGAVRLRELSEAGVLELVRSVFGAVPHAERTARRLHEATNGNPAHCLSLIERWVTTGVVSYVGGAWVLPIDIEDTALPGAEDLLVHRLEECAPAARAVAEQLAVADCPVPVSLVDTLLEGDRSSSLELLAELAALEIVVAGGDGYSIGYEPLRRAIYERIPDERRRSLHAAVGEALLAAAGTPEERVEAGQHLILAGQRTRGADLIARVARQRTREPGDLSHAFSRMVGPLEVAHAVYEEEGRKNIERLFLLVPLCLASGFASPAIANRYGDDTMARLYRALGLPADPDAVDENALFSAFGAAPVLEPGEERTEETPDVVTLVTWLVSAAMTLVSVGSATIDHVFQARYSRYLAPFRFLGESHPAAFAYRITRNVIAMTEDRMSAAHAAWSDALARVDSVALPEDTVQRIRLGALYSLGVLECQRDDDRVLSRLAEIESRMDSVGEAFANQLRFLFHGFRGEIELAERYHQRVEAIAVQRGTAWQVEIWSKCTLAGVYGNTRDGGGNRRVTEELQRHAKTIPSLDLYYRRSLATQALITGNPARAITLYEETLAESPPRARIGWGAVRGALARAENDLGNHERALQIAEETIQASAEDRDYVAMNLGPYLERVSALTGLGRLADARAALDELFRRHEGSANPMTMGSLHRLGTLLAEREGNEEESERHLSEMERWFRSTKNPALVSQCEAIRAVRNRGLLGPLESKRGAASTFAGAASVAQSVLGDCRGPDERMRRALELVAERTGASEAWLFTVSERREPVQAGSLAGADAPAELRREIAALFQRYLAQSEATNCVDATSASNFSAVPVPTAYRTYALTVASRDSVLLVGAVAVPYRGNARLISHTMLQQIAAQLYGAGDLPAARLAG
ncbi:MAG TPA: protein kinase [Polyangiaceae bacterium]|nr:protein kinase [Polyangiaceae bacterium]